ncbi:MAG TPA: glycosyltransferase [Thermoanaerobaculia bacterium]|jgi:glycosyltransferase involved in cell wall biosynthesis
MTRIAVLTPLPPTRSGVAHYSSLVVPALGATAFETLEDYRREDYDEVIYQLGNNPHHELMYREAMREPGVAVLHDLVLHHLIVELTLARGDAEGYIAALEASHGPAGAAWARGRAAGLHSEMGNFLLPASVEVAQRSKSVIVHNQYAKERLLSFGVTTPIHVVPHPYVPETRTFDRTALRARLGFTPADRVIGFFGFLTSAKRAEVVLQTFQAANDPRLKLLIVGEPAPNIDVKSLQGEGIVLTGYVADDDFPSYYAAADRFVNLRYPSAGETSGTLIRAFDAGKPVAVSDYAQFAELPDEIVFKVPFDREQERLLEFFTADLPSPADAQRRWLEQNATLDRCVEGYQRALSDTAPVTGNAQPATIPLFPELTIQRTETGLALTNRGTSTIRTRTYGQPEYRLIAQVVREGRVVDDRWLALPCDLRPGATATIDYTPRAEGTLRLYHALQDVPIVEVTDVR